MKCKTCNISFDKKPHRASYEEWSNRIFCSNKCRGAEMAKMRGNKTPNWKGENVKVLAIHRWLQVNYGKPSKCEGIGNVVCKPKSSWYDWALRNGCTYQKKRENFLRLCRSCHRKYDLTDEKKKKMIKNLTWYKKRNGQA